MHIYIYDSFLQNKKYESIIAKIETRLTDLGLNGKIIRLGLLQSLDESIKNELKKGAKTIVAVGNNELFHKCLNSVMRFAPDNNFASAVPLGYIPIEAKQSSIANTLGIPVGVEACNILSARRVERLDVGEVNDSFFLCEAVISTIGTNVNVNDNYSIEINGTGQIAIVNLPNDFNLPPNYKSSALDGRLEFCIKTKKASGFLSIGNKNNDASIFSFKELFIDNKKNATISIDSAGIVNTPARVILSKKKINLIVGKGREF